jgi:hypothetical protein
LSKLSQLTYLGLIVGSPLVALALTALAFRKFAGLNFIPVKAQNILFALFLVTYLFYCYARILPLLFIILPVFQFVYIFLISIGAIIFIRTDGFK